MKSIYNIPQVRSQPTTAITPISNLTDVNIAGVSNGQGLVYENATSKWTNKNIVNSFNTRTGDVVSANNDYDITQIANASELADSTNINVSAKATKDYIAYNGTQWVSKTPTFYTDIVQTSGGNFTAQLNYIYHTLSDHIDIPLCSGSDLGKRILFTGSHILNFSVDLFLRNTLGPFSISTGNGGIELIVIGTNTYDYVSMSGQYVNTATNKKFIVSSLNDLSNTAIGSPANGEVLSFNGTNWTNSTANNLVSSVFARTGAIVASSGDYNISQITNASTLANSANVNINLPAVNQFLKFNGSIWVNDNASFYLSNNSYTNTSFTPTLQSINWAPGSTATMPNCGLSDVGKRLLFLTGNGQNVSIFFPLGIQLYEFDGGHSNFTMLSNYGAIEFCVSGSNIYSIVSCSGAFLNPANSKAVLPRNLDGLYDTNLTVVSVNDKLVWDGLKWVNNKHKSYIYLNSNANLSNNQFLQQIGQTGNLERAEFTFPRAGVISRVYINHNIAPGAGTRTYTVYVGGVASSMTGSITGTTKVLEITTNNVIFTAGEEIALFHTQSGATASVGNGYFEYYFTSL